MVANRLPLTVEYLDGRHQCRESSGGLIAAVSAYLNHDGRETFGQRFWAGVPGCDEDAWKSLSNTGKADFTYLPVFPATETYERYYDGFANSLLWPLLHYFPSYAEYHDADFGAYMEVNRLFADRLLAEVRPGDVIWIHDYHLLPLAAMLRQRSPGLSIGFFLHIPFPVFEVFRLIPKHWRQELLQGMLGADLIGFHTTAYRDYFLQAVEQVLQIRAVDGEIAWQGRLIGTGAFPVGIDFNHFHHAGELPEVQHLTEQYRALKDDKLMLFSVDRLDYTKGVHHRIKGYKKFLIQHPEYCGKIMFVLVIVPSRHHIKTYAERKRMIDEYIGDINSSLGAIDWKPLIYQYQHLDFAELAALYRACDVALITPLRDGMNLVAKEFAASRNEGDGVLILSELAGAAHDLHGAVLINPNDADEIASAIQLALEMDKDEQQSRLAMMQAQLREYDVNRWAATLLTHLEMVTNRRLENGTRLIDPFTRATFLKRFSSAQRRLLLLDYDGTLAPLTRRPEQALPSNELLGMLAALSVDEFTEVYIISGRDSMTLENWFGHLPIGLIAEHGAKIKKTGDTWNAVAPDLDHCWPQVEALMNACIQKCPRSFLEYKEFSRAWHYREAEPFHSELKAAELFRMLADCTSRLPLKVLNGHKVIEVRSTDVHKGEAVSNLLRTSDYDFVLCAGDDETDEDMFRVLSDVPGAFTIRIGEQPTLACYRLLTPYQLHALLDNMLNSPVPLNKLN